MWKEKKQGSERHHQDIAKKLQERIPREEIGRRMRPSTNLARTGDQDPPEGRRRSPKVRPPADRAEQPRTV